jgi:hypothetical protein
MTSSRSGAGATSGRRVAQPRMPHRLVDRPPGPTIRPSSVASRGDARIAKTSPSSAHSIARIGKTRSRFACLDQAPAPCWSEGGADINANPVAPFSTALMLLMRPLYPVRCSDLRCRSGVARHQTADHEWTSDAPNLAFARQLHETLGSTGRKLQ